MIREHTKQIKVGNIIIGGQNKVVIQSMCNIKTEKVDEVVNQILEMEKEGLELIRVSVLDFKDAAAIKEIPYSVVTQESLRRENKNYLLKYYK